MIWVIAQPDFKVKQGPDLFMPYYVFSGIGLQYMHYMTIG